MTSPQVQALVELLAALASREMQLRLCRLGRCREAASEPYDQGLAAIAAAAGEARERGARPVHDL